MGKYKVDISGYNTSNLETLTSQEMKVLFEQINTNPIARDLLIEGNLKLVLSILKKFYNKTDNMDDLFQIGCIGLIKAIDNFDLKYNVQFSTYAVPMILGEIKRYMRDNNTLRISRSLKDIAFKAIKVKEDYYQKNGYEISYQEIAKELGVNEFDVYNALNAMKDPISMYEPIYNDGGDTIYLCDQIIDERYETDFSKKMSLDNAVNSLNRREKYILDERYVMGKTQMEIAEELDISQAQVSRIEKKAIKELKKVLK
ncbi:MAG: SigB/SigF/SigG family RNA polymerase sigma factor [Bacilli bacterium]|nr:SigB/SigF/SigG family RNA polymerase sigma factor [Bacilli bacterium]